MCCKGAVPWRTIMALVKAAKLMVMAAKPTQMPVLAGGGEESLTRRKSPLAGTRFLQPPFPEPWLGKRSGSIFGGSWTVVAILLILLREKLRALPEDYFSSSGLLIFSAEICIV